MKTKFVFPQPEIPAQTMADLGCRLCSTFQKRSGIPVRSFEYTREFCELYFSFTAQIFSSVNTNNIRIGSFEPLEKITTTCDALFYRLSCKSFSFRSFKWFKPKVSRNDPTSWSSRDSCSGNHFPMREGFRANVWRTFRTVVYFRVLRGLPFWVYLWYLLFHYIV